jgi:malate dehydrogenase
MNSKKKVSIIGAGAVGATLAQRVLESAIADVVLVDVMKNMAVGKAYDLLDASSMIGHEANVVGTDDYKEIASSDIVVITAGLARKPGMIREDLIAKNAKIVKDVSENIKKYAPESIVIVVTNPLDTMTYLTYKTTGFKKEKVFGMAGLLDGSRFVYLIADALKVARSSVNTYILGSHGDTMVPVLSKTTISGKPILDVMPQDKLNAVVKRTRQRGAEIVNLMASGSAYFSPSAAVFKMIKTILNDEKETIVVSAYLDGEYGLKDIAIGVPCKIGKKGIDEIVEFELSEEEDVAFREGAKAIKSSIDIL